MDTDGIYFLLPGEYLESVKTRFKFLIGLDQFLLVRVPVLLGRCWDLTSLIRNLAWYFIKMWRRGWVK